MYVMLFSCKQANGCYPYILLPGGTYLNYREEKNRRWSVVCGLSIEILFLRIFLGKYTRYYFIFTLLITNK